MPDGFLPIPFAAMPRPLDVLVLYMHVTALPMRPTMASHLRFLERGAERHRIVYFNLAGRLPRFVRRSATTSSCCTTACSPRAGRLASSASGRRRWLCATAARSSWRCRRTSTTRPTSSTTGWWTPAFSRLLDLRRPARDALYPRATRTARFEQCLTGYVDEDDRRAGGGTRPTPSGGSTSPTGQVGCRTDWARTGRSSTGSRWRSPTRARARARRHVATAESAVMFGGAWLDFLASARWCSAARAERARWTRGGRCGHSSPPARGRPRSDLRRVRRRGGGLGWPCIHRDKPASLRGGPGRLVPAARARPLRRRAGAGTALHPARRGPERHRRACERARDAELRHASPCARSRRGGERPAHLRRLRAALRGCGARSCRPRARRGATSRRAVVVAAAAQTSRRAWPPPALLGPTGSSRAARRASSRRPPARAARAHARCAATVISTGARARARRGVRSAQATARERCARRRPPRAKRSLPSRASAACGRK